MTTPAAKKRLDVLMRAVTLALQGGVIRDTCCTSGSGKHAVHGQCEAGSQEYLNSADSHSVHACKPGSAWP